MMRFQVLLTEDAMQDLDEIHDDVGRHDDSGSAERVLTRLGAAIEGLAANPERGSHPKELLTLGIREYRQVSFKPYRMIYRVVERRVYVYLVADGRRDMQPLLARRLLGA